VSLSRLRGFCWSYCCLSPGKYGEDALDLPEVGILGVPVAYVLSEDDRALGGPGAGAKFAARLGVEPIMVPGSHESLQTHPDEVAQALLKA
jgi:hypothetical protein